MKRFRGRDHDGQDPQPAYVGATVQGRTYVCGDPTCVATGTADEMYNLACNPHAVREADIGKLIRCSTCATRLAKQRRVPLEEPGCGLFPLALTLRQMTTAAPSTDSSLSFLCMEPGCPHRGDAAAMFNIACNTASVGLDGLIEQVRCHDCAIRIAAQRGCLPGERSSRIYPLTHTLSKMPDWPPTAETEARLHALLSALGASRAFDEK